MNTVNNSIPGPGFFQFIKNVRSNPVLYCYELMKKYGDVVRCPSIQDIYLISDPLLAKEIFLNAHKLFDKNNFINSRLKYVMGEGVVVTTGDKWKKQRKAGQEVFGRSDLQTLEPEITRQVDQLVERWKEFAGKKNLINLHHEMRDLSMRTMAGSLLLIEDEAILDQLRKSFQLGNEFVSDPTPFNLPSWLPFSQKNKLGRSLAFIDSVISNEIMQHLGSGRHRGRMIGAIADQTGEDGEKLSREEMLAEAKNIFLSAYFSTSDLLSWLVYALARYQEWSGKIAGEPAQYSSQFIHEVLRLYPPAWASSHRTIEPLELGNYVIPKNVTVMTSIYNLHRHPGYWEEAEKFRPERFSEGFEMKDKSMFVPYGFGPRKCLGMGMARIIINQVCIKIASNFKLQLGNNVSPQVQSRVTLGAKKDIEIYTGVLTGSHTRENTLS